MCNFSFGGPNRGLWSKQTAWLITGVGFPNYTVHCKLRNGNLKTESESGYNNNDWTHGLVYTLGQNRIIFVFQYYWKTKKDRMFIYLDRTLPANKRDHYQIELNCYSRAKCPFPISPNISWIAGTRCTPCTRPPPVGTPTPHPQTISLVNSVKNIYIKILTEKDFFYFWN